MARGLPKEDGYQAGLATCRELFKICQGLGIKELTFYGFTQDNTKRPKEQTKAFQKAPVWVRSICSPRRMLSFL